MGQELDMAETKCLTIKSELSYMMDVCQKGQMEVKERKGTPTVEQIASLFKSPSSKSSVEYYNCKFKFTPANKTPNCNSLRRLHNIEQKAEENSNPSTLSPKSTQLSPRKNIDDDDNGDDTAKCEILKEETQKGLLNVTITPRSRLNKMLSLKRCVNQANRVSPCEQVNNKYESSSSSYPECVHEYQSMLSIESSVEGFVSRMDKDHLCITPNCMQEDTGEAELNLDTSNDTKTKQTVKCKYAPGNDANSTCKMNEAATRIRKRKGKLRSSDSKSTVMTKDTGRKEARRRKNKGHVVTRQQSVLLKHTKKSNDVVEIFHNTTLKSSNSRVSSKYSKLGRGTKYTKKQKLAETADQKTKKKSYSEHVVREHQFHDKKNEQNRCREMLNHKSSPSVTTDSVQKQYNSNDSPTQCKAHQREQTVYGEFNDSMFTPNYEMPTLASKLKRSSRSYFGRFNSRNIPFVVSTSVTPSHNLGLNIQQVLNVMKTRQPIMDDITPLLIRKVSRSMRPVSTLLEQINMQYDRSIFDLKSQTTGQLNNKESPNIKQDRRLSMLELQHVAKAQSVQTAESDIAKTIPGSDSARFYKEKDDFYEECKMKQQPTVVANRNSTSDNIGDHKMHVADPHHSKEIRDVLINLHDQFEEMNTRYETLQSEMERSDDAALSKQLSSLEKELQVKEEEINAIVGLYKEVMSLKQQMKTLHKKSSLGCVATGSTIGMQKSPFPLSLISGKSQLTNTAQILGRRRASNVYGGTRELPVSMQLTALLRQIQTFHKQLVS
ncbi:hypothetical protein EAI_06082 [Harpegnathos saltator]|uniref:Centrosomal protein of 57 kDa n=1 Tax=Harpegnathos saltator TaxID=610380 RepID=E2BAF0_HARSA|nr:hypothetical protein EAI_06082 [Harpegnathos saltator]